MWKYEWDKSNRASCGRDSVKEFYRTRTNLGISTINNAGVMARFAEVVKSNPTEFSLQTLNKVDNDMTIDLPEYDGSVDIHDYNKRLDLSSHIHKEQQEHNKQIDAIGRTGAGWAVKAADEQGARTFIKSLSKRRVRELWDELYTQNPDKRDELRFGFTRGTKSVKKMRNNMRKVFGSWDKVRDEYEKMEATSGDRDETPEYTSKETPSLEDMEEAQLAEIKEDLAPEGTAKEDMTDANYKAEDDLRVLEEEMRTERENRPSHDEV